LGGRLVARLRRGFFFWLDFLPRLPGRVGTRGLPAGRSLGIESLSVPRMRAESYSTD